MKVVHFITTIERGGAETALLTLLRMQVRHYSSITVIPLKGEAQLKRDMELLGVKVETRLLNKPFLFQLFIITFLKLKPDVFHAHLPRAELLVYLARKRPFIVTRHNSELFYLRLFKWISSLISRVVTRSSSAVIAISKAVAAFLSDNNELSKQSSCKVVYYGYDRKEKNVYSIKSIGNIEKIRFVTVSRLVPQKNISLMLRFIAKLQESNIDATLTVIGSGPLLNSLVKESEKHKLREVFFVGKKSDIVSFVSDYDAFILASNYEGFGLALLEAMDAGLIIFAPNNSAVPEVLGLDHPGLFTSGDVEDLSRVFWKVKTSPKLQEKVAKIQSTQLDFFDSTSYFYGIDSIYRNVIRVKSK
jgi:glycosyltransferase involved in cell wall biosynthesis